jgi:hypothetical protein
MRGRSNGVRPSKRYSVQQIEKNLRFPCILCLNVTNPVAKLMLHFVEGNQMVHPARLLLDRIVAASGNNELSAKIDFPLQVLITTQFLNNV